jgi:hypothetical protein
LFSATEKCIDPENKGSKDEIQILKERPDEDAKKEFMLS